MASGTNNDAIEQAKKENRTLLRLIGEQQEDWPAKIGKAFGCFEDRLETTLKSEIGEGIFDGLVAKAQAQYGIAKKKHALKNPMVISEVLRNAAKDGHSSDTLNSIVKTIIELRQSKAPVRENN